MTNEQHDTDQIEDPHKHAQGTQKLRKGDKQTSAQQNQCIDSSCK